MRDSRRRLRCRACLYRQWRRRSAAARSSVPAHTSATASSAGNPSGSTPRATIMSASEIGNRVVLYPGCVIGSEGFGWAFVDGKSERIPQIGNVVLEDDVEIGANSCIDRAQTGSTLVGAGTKIDNLVQIGHNCRIGKHCVIAALTGLAGSTIIGDYLQGRGPSWVQGPRYGGFGRNDRRSMRPSGATLPMARPFPAARAQSSRGTAPRGHDSQIAKAVRSCRGSRARTLAAIIRVRQATLRRAASLRGNRSPHRRDAAASKFGRRGPMPALRSCSARRAFPPRRSTSSTPPARRFWASDGATVSTTEHLLSALFAMGVSNAEIRR